MEETLRRLRGFLGDRVRTDEATRRAFAFDGMKIPGTCDAVVRVEAAEEVGTVLRLANEAGIPVTARATGSSLTGSAVPWKGGWVLDLSALQECSIHPEERLARVGCGTKVGDLQSAAEARGLFYPPDPSSKKYSTIGGNIACNAGGMRCVKYGVTRDYVVSLQGYFASGEPFNFGREVKKYATGYNLRDLLIGSEGTLGVITGASLRLIPKPDREHLVLAAFGSEALALRACRQILEDGQTPSIMEFLDVLSVGGAERTMGAPIFPEMPGRALLILQVDGDADAVEKQRRSLLKIIEAGAEAWREAAEVAEAEKFWEIRRACSSSMFALGNTKLNNDVVVPLPAQEALLSAIDGMRQRTGMPIAVFGHAGDGNLHVNIMFNQEDPHHREHARGVLGEVMETVIRLGGAISGEHGIGLQKTPFLSSQLSAAELEAMRAIKRALDPKGILNPGKIFEPVETWNENRVLHRFEWDRH
ncbi:MAG: FAD-binding oxidoreductase [Puniceicoccaceae bacterium]